MIKKICLGVFIFEIGVLQKKLGFKFKLREQDDYSDSIYVDELDVTLDKTRLKNTMRTLYNEAQDLEL